jgi:hypothetical protein
MAIVFVRVSKFVTRRLDLDAHDFGFIVGRNEIVEAIADYLNKMSYSIGLLAQETL